ncbi:hypothetical protein ACUXGS_000718 [Staphylococcus hominis]
MMYDKQAIKQFIMDYHKEKASTIEWFIRQIRGGIT